MTTLLSRIRCPACGGQLKQSGAVRCLACKAVYPYKNGVLNLLSKDVFKDQHNEQQKKYYDREYGDDYANSDFEWRKRYIARIKPYLPSSKNAVILDAACGQGYVALALAEMGYYVIANDIAIEGLRRAYRIAKIRRLDRKILFIASDLNITSLKAGSIDAAIMLHVLEHLRDDRAVVKNIASILKRGGTAVVGVPLAFRYVFPLFIPLYWYSDQKVGHFRHYALEDLLRIFGKTFSLQKVYYTGHIIKLIGAVLSVLRITRFEKTVEDIDERQIESKFWASNIMTIFKKSSL